MKKTGSLPLVYVLKDIRLILILEGIFVGLFVGIVIVLYRIVLEKTYSFSQFVYQSLINHQGLIPLWFILLFVSGWIVGVLISKDPMISGSGIIQVKGLLVGKLKMNWLRVLSGKFISGILCMLAGLSLGRQGPSIQMGAAIGQGFSRIFKNRKIKEKFLITSGASAGLAAAFNAPLSGVIFALEEIHKNFSPLVLSSALAASITADFVSMNVFGLEPIFKFQSVTSIPLNIYYYLLPLGIFVGIAGVMFNKSLLKFQDIYASIKFLPQRFKPIIAFIVAGCLGLTLPIVLGGGHGLIEYISQTPLTLKFLMLLLVVKFIFTMISYGSSAPGGIFLPLLVIGALVGIIYSKALTIFFGFSETYSTAVLILAMAGMLTSVVKAPITGCVLITELTGSFSHLHSVAFVCLISYVVADIFKSHPIYETLLKRFLDKGDSKFKGNENKKVIIEISIFLGSQMDGKMIKDLSFPKSCLVVGIKRGSEEIIPKGNTILLPGDQLEVLVKEDLVGDVRKFLSDAGEEIHIKSLS